jgi:AraC-like DNA-binding protein
MSRIPPRLSTGLKSQPPGYSFQTPEYDQFQLIYVGAGRLFFTARGAVQPLGPGALLLLRYGGVFRLHTGPAQGYSGVFCAAIAPDEPAFRGPPAAFVAAPVMQTLATLLEQELGAPGLDSAPILQGLAQSLTWTAIRAAGAGAAVVTQADYSAYWSERVRLAIQASLYADRTVREVVAPLGMSYRQLARHFRETFGCSPKQYQVRARIEEAQRLLRQTRLPVTTVAYELGYPSSQHFATQFAQVAGISPTRYRREQETEPA